MENAVLLTKGITVWIICTDATGCYVVQTAHVARTSTNGQVQVHFRYERDDGTAVPKLAVKYARDVFLDRKQALTTAAERSRVASDRHYRRSAELDREAKHLV